MNAEIPSLVRHLRALLHADVDSLCQKTDGKLEARARQRLVDVAEHFPPFLTVLVEPWLAEPLLPDALATLEGCARVHLYARILDDALDENLSIHRLTLLRVQPLFWRSVSALAILHPGLQDSCTKLLQETVGAVEKDDAASSPACWGAKNHHLLLAPLLLSGGGVSWQAVRRGLSALIACAQAADEWHQGDACVATLRPRLLSELSIWIDPENLIPLRQHGWHEAAGRLTRDARALLERIQTITTANTKPKRSPKP